MHNFKSPRWGLSILRVGSIPRLREDDPLFFVNLFLE